MALCDLQFLLIRIRAKLDDLHTVEQGTRDGIGRVGRRDEHAAVQIERNLQIVVAELRILLRIEHFEQRGRWVALVVTAELVHLVEQQQRIAALGLCDGGHDAARHRADVRLAVAADLSLVAHAAERQPRELAVQRLCNRDGDRRLANTRRADQAENLPRQLRCELPHGQRLQDTLLDLLESKVVGIENLPRRLHIQPFLRFLVPRQIEYRVEVIADDVRLRRAALLPPETLDLAQQLFLRRLRKPQRTDALGVILVVAVVLAKLFADGVDLLTQVIIALVFVDIFLYFFGNFTLELQNVQLLRQQLNCQLQSLNRVQLLQNALLLVVRERRVLADHIGKLARLVRA